jgi:hypothetical protein
MSHGTTRLSRAILCSAIGLFAIMFSSSTSASNPLYPQIPEGGSAVRPSGLMDLSGWKLQIPGGTSMATISSVELTEGYESRFFSVDGEWILFSLDAAERGTSANTTYVRSELRHEKNWNSEETHELEVTIRAEAEVTTAGYTVAQIHKLIVDSDTSPTLRIEIKNGYIQAVIKDNGKYETINLKPYADGAAFKLKLRVEAGTLTVSIDERLMLTRTLSVWPGSSYFKTGCYPQAHSGFFRVWIQDISVR